MSCPGASSFSASIVVWRFGSTEQFGCGSDTSGGFNSAGGSATFGSPKLAGSHPTIGQARGPAMTASRTLSSRAAKAAQVVGQVSLPARRTMIDGIATYSQVGARFGFGLGWTLVVTFPLMTAIQEISARIGRVTGLEYCRQSPQILPSVASQRDGGAARSRQHDQHQGRPRRHGGRLKLLIGGRLSVCRRVCSRLRAARSVRPLFALRLVLKPPLSLRLTWQRCSLSAPWLQVLHVVLPPFSLNKVTSSPSRPCWGRQSRPTSSSGRPRRKLRTNTARKTAVEGCSGASESCSHPRRYGRRHGPLNTVALFIVITTAATLRARHHRHQTSARRGGVRPLPGRLPSRCSRWALSARAFGDAGISGICRLCARRGNGLSGPGAKSPACPPSMAPSLATVIGVVMNFSPIDPIRRCFRRRDQRRVVAVPMIAIMMLMTHRKDVWAVRHSPVLRGLGWLATAAMPRRRSSRWQ